jgi:hypothetical protein
MTTNELTQAKADGAKVNTPQGTGYVNGIGNRYTYVYFPEHERIIEFPNAEISRA